MSARRRAAGEEGFVLVVAITILAILLLVVAATLAQALRGIRTSTAFRSREAALHAADSGLDLALWRSNKLLLFASATGSTLLSINTIQQLGCVKIQVGGGGGSTPLLSINQGVTGTPWCSATGSENAGGGATFRYWVSNGIQIGAGSTLSMTRKVVAVGTSGTIVRRVFALFTFKLGSNGNPLSTWTEGDYIECPSVSPSTNSQTPDAGCPNPTTSPASLASPTGTPA